MQIKITNEKDNPVLKRKELEMDIDYQGGATPSRVDLVNAVAKEKNAQPDKIEIRNLISSTGFPSGKAKVMIWEQVPDFVQKRIDKKKEKAAKKAPAEAPKEEAKEAKPEEKPAEKPAANIKEEKEKVAPKEEEKK